MLPWIKEENNVVTHCRQVGILSEINGNVSLINFCECNSFNILKVGYLSCLLKGDHRALFHPGPENKFASKVLQENITGNCLIYIPDTDMTRENLDHLVENFRRA